MNKRLANTVATFERSFFWGFFYYFGCARGDEVFG